MRAHPAPPIVTLSELTGQLLLDRSPVVITDRVHAKIRRKTVVARRVKNIKSASPRFRNRGNLGVELCRLADESDVGLVALARNELRGNLVGHEDHVVRVAVDQRNRELDHLVASRGLVFNFYVQSIVFWLPYQDFLKSFP